MKVCDSCGALYLESSPYLYECKACTNHNTYDDSGDGMHSQPVRDLTPEERKALWHWLAQYEEGDGR